jgi:hypothetical protein
MSVHTVPTSGAIRPSALPLRHATDALRVVGAILNDPPRSELVCLLLDDARRGSASFVVTDPPDEGILDVVGIVTQLGDSDQVCGVVFASHRPGHGHLPVPADHERCEMLVEALADAGMALVDWFIVDDGLASSVPALGGRPSAWVPSRH